MNDASRLGTWAGGVELDTQSERMTEARARNDEVGGVDYYCK